MWEFARDSTPSRLRLRFGDADYDWDHRVKPRAARLKLARSLAGHVLFALSATEPSAFKEMIEMLYGMQGNVNFNEFAFIDLGSGKGRTLLMASDYPFRRIVGVELLPSLHRMRRRMSPVTRASRSAVSRSNRSAPTQLISLPEEPLLLYLFNPFLESGFRRTVANLKNSLQLQSEARVCALPQSTDGARAGRTIFPEKNCRRATVLHLRGCLLKRR